MKKEKILYLVIPCYNEDAVLPETTRRLTVKLDQMTKTNLISSKSKILYIDDGSTDNTWSSIESLHKEYKRVAGLKLAKNRGHQNALLAGLMTAKDCADIAISMDADLQDDIEVLNQFIKEYQNGSEIVYGVRSSRKKDSFFKRNTAQLFYTFMKWLGVDIVYNHADYRLMSKRAIEELARYGEVNLFLRGIIPQIGLRTAVVKYERQTRFAGESKYPLKKMLNFALEGILSFSVRPLRIITILGSLISLASFIFLIYVIIGHFVNGNVAGWTTTVALVCFFGGFQILCIGIIGEYIGKIYSETKRRPRYIIEKSLIN
ncbi:glycosyltransferase [Candidatus Saccharibacteria bacterium]|nr:glycosyltransferase [Candidatus Saccharibacteria bacterium]MBQ6130451.1 glycosyltransferase [Candidatus Saccharibacteria bacterium]